MDPSTWRVGDPPTSELDFNNSLGELFPSVDFEDTNTEDTVLGGEASVLPEDETFGGLSHQQSNDLDCTISANSQPHLTHSQRDHGDGGTRQSKKKRGKKASIQESEWDAQRRNIFRLFIKENHTLDEVMLEMRKLHNFNATKKMYITAFQRWGPEFRKNTTNKGKAMVPGGENNKERRRSAQVIPLKAVNSAESLGAPVVHVNPALKPPGLLKHQEAAFHALDALIKRSYGASKSQWIEVDGVPKLVVETQALNDFVIWQLLDDECNRLAELSRSRRQISRFCAALRRFFRDLRAATSWDDPSTVLIHTFTICTTLAEMHPRQRRPALLKAFLIYLNRWLFTRRKDHDLLEYLKELRGALDISPENFKCTLGALYTKALDTFRMMIGKHSPVVLRLTAHIARHWKSAADARVDTELLGSYESALAATESEHGRYGKQTFMMLCDYAFALRHNEIVRSASASKNRDMMQQAQQLELRCERLAEECRQRADQLLPRDSRPAYTLVTRAFVFSTELLAKIHVSNNNRVVLGQLENAIQRLQGGDEDCKSWAASFSQTLARSRMTFGDKTGYITERKRTTGAEKSDAAGSKRAGPLAPDSSQARWVQPTPTDPQGSGPRISATRRRFSAEA